MATRISLLDHAAMNKLLQTMIENGGEGLILRKKDSLYESGRTRSLLKLKVWSTFNLVVSLEFALRLLVSLSFFFFCSCVSYIQLGIS